MVDIHLHLDINNDKCKALFAKYFGIDMCNFTAFISEDDNGDDTLVFSSDEISMTFTRKKIEEIIIDLFDNDSSKIDDVNTHIINNTERGRKYVSIGCKISRDCVKSIMDIFG